MANARLWHVLHQERVARQGHNTQPICDMGVVVVLQVLRHLKNLCDPAVYGIFLLPWFIRFLATRSPTLAISRGSYLNRGVGKCQVIPLVVSEDIGEARPMDARTHPPSTA